MKRKTAVRPTQINSASWLSRPQEQVSHKIKIATRASKLALYQANWVGKQLQQHHQDLAYELIKVKNLPINHKDSFVKLCEEALLAGAADIAVHSAKDLPVADRHGLVIGACCERDNALDALILAEGKQRDTRGMKFGTASPRRQTQLRSLFSDIQLQELRGNITTRLDAVGRGEGEGEPAKLDAIVLAAAGLNRLGLQDRISHYFSPQEMVPAAGQGVIAVQHQESREDLAKLVAPLNHLPSQLALVAERQCCHILEADCNSAVGAYAFFEDDIGSAGKLALNAYGMVGDMKGDTLLKSYQSVASDNWTSAGGKEAALKCGELLAKDLLQHGAKKFLYQT